MANLQPLSPQGYNIKDEPYNTNPFWGDDENPDPSIYTRLTALEEDVENLDTYKADKSQLNNYYTKVEVTDLLNNIPIFDSSLYYTKTEVNGQIADNTTEIETVYLPQYYYNKTQVDTLLSGKVGTSTLDNYYTKTEVDAIVLDINGDITDIEGDITALQGNVGTLGTTVDNLGQRLNSLSGTVSNHEGRITANENAISTLQTGKADKANTYTKTEVDALIPDMTNYYTKAEIDATIGDIQTILEAI